MVKPFRRAKDKSELENKEAEGLWHAIARVKEIGEGNEKISSDTVLKIHRTIFEFAVPEYAGRLRRNGEDIQKLKCIEPPPGRLVPERFHQFWRDLDTHMAAIPRRPSKQTKKQREKWYNGVITLAAWTQHQITSIHPFCEGNGRMARLMTNLVLQRYGLPPSRVKYEGENKQAYLSALCQIDNHQDMEPLKHLIGSAIFEAQSKERRIRQQEAAKKRKN